MAKSIGLDIGSRGVKLVEIEGSAKRYRVTNFIAREFPGEGGAVEGEIVAETVAEMIKEGKAARDSLVTCLDSSDIVMREIMVPFLQDDQIKRVLRFEAEAHLHNYAIEDVVVDHLKVGEVKDQSKLIIFAAPKDRILERLSILKPAGADPMHVTLDLAALFNAAKAAGAFEEHPTAILLDIGATTTNIILVRDGQLKSCRSLRTGSESITRVLAQDLAVDTDSARGLAEEGDRRPREDDLLAPLTLDEDEEVEETEKSASQLENALVVQRQDDFLGKVFRETTRSIANSLGSSVPTAIYLTGGASLASGTKERLEERFRKPVVRLDFLAGDGHAVDGGDVERTNARIGIALGCALDGLGYEGISLEFRREELRYTRKFDLIKVALASTVSLIFILLFLNWLNAQNTLKIRRSEVASILKEVNERYYYKVTKEYEDQMKESNDRVDLRPVRPDVFHQYSDWQSNIRAIYKNLTSELGYNVQNIPPIRSALVVWRDLFDALDAIRADLGYLYIEDIGINQKQLDFSGLVGNPGKVDELRLAVSRLKFVKDASMGVVEEDKKTGKFRFSIRAALEKTEIEREAR
jgi:type IV pilus assembly protein PilM